MSLPAGLREKIQAARDAGFGLDMSADRIIFDGMGVQDSVVIERGDKDDGGSFDELRALVAEIFTKPPRPDA